MEMCPMHVIVTEPFQMRWVSVAAIASSTKNNNGICDIDELENDS